MLSRFGSSKKLYRRGAFLSGESHDREDGHAALLLPATADEPRRGSRGQARAEPRDATLHAPGPSEEYLPGERCTTPPSQGLPLTYSRERVVVRSLLGGPWVAVAQNVDDDLT